jgi:tetratricopeptide (TPR) repeat protein
MDIGWIPKDIVWKVIGTILIAAGGGSFLATKAWLRKARAKHTVRAADGTQFAILVAELANDANKGQTNHILIELEKQFPPRGEARLQVLPYPEVLAIGPGERNAAIAAAEVRGRKWLKQKRADVLIWGEVGAADKVLRLRFLAPEGGSGSDKPYSLNADLELPPDFGADLGAIIAVQAAASIAPVIERSGEALAALIEPAVAKLRPLAENPPASMSGDARARLWRAFALGEYRLGEERGDNERLVNAIAYFRKVLEEWPRERVPLDWAMTQNNLGGALVRLGERESGTARLQEAVAAFREALKECMRERAPLAWATTQNNLSTALMRIGERETGTARLEQAVAAFREALKERTRERVPLGWATTQNNLGSALVRLGERESSTARLEEAVAAYREALKERTRERVPLDWAMTQNNLGDALRSLGERESGTARLEEAAAAFREALKEWRRERAPLDWAGAQNNLGTVLFRLGNRENGTARLEDAVAAYREALKERTRERVPLDWAMTQNNLGIALACLGERAAATAKPKGCAALEKARKNFAEALEEFRKAGATYHVGMAERNIARLDGVIARLCG